MNFAHTQISSFTIEPRITEITEKFDILKGTKIEGEPILGFRVLIKTNSKSKQNLNQFLKAKPNKIAEPKSY